MAGFSSLMSGARGPSVELLQLGLKRSGNDPGEIDGIFGNRTLLALNGFRRQMGLPANGIADMRVYRALLPYLRGYRLYRVVPGDTLYKIANVNGISIAALETANPDADALDLRPGTLLVVPMAFDVVPENISFTFEVLELCIEGLAARYPFMTTEVVGLSVMEKPLYVLRIGNGPNEVFYNASHHANEWITSVLLMRFAEEYLRAYAFETEIFGENASDLFRKTTLYIMPMVDPDGVDLVTGALTSGQYYANSRIIAADYPSVSYPSGWKANIDGTDLNLQYPAGWERAREIKFSQGFVSPAPRDYVGPGPLTAPESLAVYRFTLRNNFSLTLSYHTQGEVIFWRYADIEPPGAFEIANMFSAVSGYAVESTPSASDNAGYKDWFLLNYNRPGYTIEAGRGTSPLPLSQFPKIFSDNLGILVLGLTATA